MGISALHHSLQEAVQWRMLLITWHWGWDSFSLGVCSGDASNFELEENNGVFDHDTYGELTTMFLLNDEDNKEIDVSGDEDACWAWGLLVLLA